MELKHVGSRKRPRNFTLEFSPNSVTPNHHHLQQQTHNLTTKTTSSSSSSNSSHKELMLFPLTPSSWTPAPPPAQPPSSDAEEASDLPCSILIDILGRLPLKTLINCSYVCKTWRSLLTESYFYKLYAHHMPTSLILEVKGNSLDTLRKICIIEEGATAPPGAGRGGGVLTRKMRLLNSPNMDPINFRFQLGNGCNGLICLRDIRTREPSIVWNPIMGQFVILPKTAAAVVDKVVAGLGFCGRTNRYKVLRVFHKRGDPPSQRRAQMYDLGVGNQWREIGDVPFDIPPRIPGFFTNNSLHWILDLNSIANGNGNKQIHDHGNNSNNSNNNNNNDNVSEGDNKIGSNCELICGFDFVEENFKAIGAPPFFGDQGNEYHWSNLGIITDCLSICAIDAKVFRPDVQVWVMEEYGVPESWALRLSIRDPTVEWWDPYRWIQVTNFHKNGEIIMLCAHCYVLAYNLRERRFRSIEALDFPAIAHVPSLISLEDVLNETLGTGSLTVRYL